MSKKTIYARFPNKDALLVAVVEDLVGGAREAVLNGMTAMADPPAQVLTRFGMQIARDWTAPRVVAIYRLIVSEVGRFPRLAEIFTTTMEMMRSTLTTYLREQADAGTLAIIDPDAGGAVPRRLCGRRTPTMLTAEWSSARHGSWRGAALNP
ncbi:TetR/AcrR family transcriptional regulator C-terminal domain-containing protein [Nonomuraea sp. NPDC049028]|uniref:TetR/AcrR family transcriptional regulator C-terminal domain-containing protein n=1 Tax=Nonomuraea sp. NPDC049028 TaxID=3364348 RepID=UPI00371E9214